MNDKKNILIGITSSIAAYKIYELIRLYKKNGYNVRVVASENAMHFVSPLIIETLSNNKMDYEQFTPRDNIEHIHLEEWADIFVIAPASVNTISKCATGVADNLLTTVFCAYLGSQKPIVFAPAMNVNMYKNMIIQDNIEKLKKVGCFFVDPEFGELACGTEGQGRLAEINTIYIKSLRYLHQDKKNNNKKVLITLGGTKEKIDSVRYITNASSGKMGTALADWTYKMGYDVTAISTVELDRPYKVINVLSADEMQRAIEKQKFDYLIMNAAVSDFRTEKISKNKIKKEDIKDSLTLKLTKNPDVVATIAKSKKKNQKIIGFCLEDKDILKNAKEKLKNKNLDYIVANDVKTALNTDKNKVTIISKSGKINNINTNTKENIAKEILEVVLD